MNDLASDAINCRRFVEMVTAYLEGDLDEETVRLVEAHLDLCDPCVVYLDQIRQTVVALSNTPFGTASDDARRTLLEAFRASGPPKT